MEINAINQSHSINIQSHGTLAIIGKSPGNVVLMASELFLYGGVNIETFARNPIFTRLIGGFGSTIIFEYKLNGELRNPQKLLKSLRNRLMRSIDVAQSEFDQRMCQIEHLISMAEHHPNRYEPVDIEGEHIGNEIEEQDDLSDDALADASRARDNEWSKMHEHE